MAAPSDGPAISAPGSGWSPKQHTTGGKPKLLGISKRGNKYLRMLFIHGARAAMPTLAKSESPLGAWLRGLLARTHRNIAIVALANKLARIAWAMLRRDRDFAPNPGALAV
jgi:transposase